MTLQQKVKAACDVAGISLTELEDRIAKSRKPAVIENGVLVQLERFVVI